MKIAQLFKLILIIIIVTSCSGKTGKVDTTLDVAEIKRESLTSVTLRWSQLQIIILIRTNQKS